MSSGKVLLGVLAGVAVGATLGILFAPDKGSKTRSKISQKGEDYAEELTGKFNDIVESITKKYEALKHDASNMAKSGKAKVEEIESELSSSRK